MDDTNRLAQYVSQLKILSHLKRMNEKGKRREKPGSVVERSKAPDSKKLLSWEFWYTNVCVDSNPFPVQKRFERDEAEPSADKFCHTGTSIQDDSAKQKKTKKIAKSSAVRDVVWGWQASDLKLNKKKDTQTRHVKHECTRGFKRKSLQMDDTNCLAE